MKRSEMIAFIKANPYVKITHFLFDTGEYIYSAKDGCVYEENNYLFEDWDEFSLAHNGIRTRVGGLWEDGWIEREKMTTETSYVDLLYKLKTDVESDAIPPIEQANIIEIIEELESMLWKYSH